MSDGLVLSLAIAVPVVLLGGGMIWAAFRPVRRRDRDDTVRAGETERDGDRRSIDRGSSWMHTGGGL